MAVFNEPNQWEHPLGNNADTSTLPDDAVATAGIASLQKLFQIINATPLEAGGIAPGREDVNALFKYLGDQIFYTLNGGVPSYNADYDYVAGRVVLYNNNIYKCIQANGVSSTVVTPGSDTAYWQRLDNYIRSVNGVGADAQGNVTLASKVRYVNYSAGISLSKGVPCPDDGFVYVATVPYTNFSDVTINGKVVVYSDGFDQKMSIGAMAPIHKGDVVDGTRSITFYPLVTAKN